jgi:hypothetical protein
MPDLEDESGTENMDAVRRHLWAAFPTDDDSRILLRNSSIPSLYIKLVNTLPHSNLTHKRLAAALPELAFPDEDSHPVILAKYMLLFAITLQSPTGKQNIGLSQPQAVLQRRLFKAATRWVTTQPEMHGTVDCLICIILEGVFEVNSGNLRSAWAVYRRAMTVAQLMGMHRSPMPTLRYIDQALEVDPRFVWFRILYMDRYLSLLLGLPQGAADTSTAALSTLQQEPPLGRFERQLTVIASRILERNDHPYAVTDTTATMSIDTELLQIATGIPASFWRPANFHNLKVGCPESLLETVRLAAQVYYYGLLIQLHLPFMMALGGNPASGYSKNTCVNASREIMSRFIAHRTFNPISSCSRPVDFFALLAGMTLLLAHLDALHSPDPASFLAHQRLSDRAMLEQALERMDVISHTNKDPVTEKSARVIRQLLDVEADAAQGNQYTAGIVTGGVIAEHGKVGLELRLQIPYLGMIKIVRQSQASQATLPPQGRVPAPDTMFTFPPHTGPLEPQTLASIRHAHQSLGGEHYTQGYHTANSAL